MTPIRTCPTCGQPFPANSTGRPKVFCSAACRRDMHGIREELPALERELEETRNLLASDYGGRTHYWKGRIVYLERAISEARMRLGQNVSRGEQGAVRARRPESRGLVSPLRVRP